VDIPASQPAAALHVGGRVDEPVDQRTPEVGGVFGQGIDQVFTRLSADRIPRWLASSASTHADGRDPRQRSNQDLVAPQGGRGEVGHCSDTGVGSCRAGGRIEGEQLARTNI
jgi:hypothetical protein